MKAHFLKIAAIAALAAGTAMAGPVVVDFQNNPNSTFVSGGVTITAAAWSLTGSSGTQLVASSLGHYSLGLGVCNVNETGCTSPEHQVDNQTNLDFVLFTFSAAVDTVSFTVTPSGNYDSDVTFYTRTLGTAFSLTNSTLANLTTLGFTQGGNDIAGTGSAHTFSVAGTGIRSILLGAKVSGNDSYLDYFKISTLNASTPDVTPFGSVPEPSTMALLGSALVGLGLLGHRKARK